MATYNYENIVGSEDVIRVLKLSSGAEEDPLHGELEVCRLDEPLSYEALSYCWGPPKMESVIDCSQGSISITKTLDRALRVLRHKNEARRLWIDQICINQQDNKERSSQVRLMYQVYSGAKRTIVWLGDDEQEHGRKARKLFSDLHSIGAVCRSHGYRTTTRPFTITMLLGGSKEFAGARFKIQEQDDQMTVNQHRWFPTDDILNQCGLPGRTSGAWTALNALLESRYFTRVWTLQEVLSSREVVLVWGTAELSWARLRGAYQWALLNGCMFQDSRRGSRSPSLHWCKFLDLDISWFRGMRYQNLADLVTTCRGAFTATDPKDNIYAFTSLASDGKEFNIDYDKFTEEVFADFSKYHILQSDNLTMLNFAGLHRDDGLHLPSWVPSWSYPLILDATGNLDKPIRPLAGGDLGPGWRRIGQCAIDGSIVKSTADRPDRLLIKGFALPKNQAKIVCTLQAYSLNDSQLEHISSQYKELSRGCASPPIFLREMVICMISATRISRFYDNEHLAQFISFIFSALVEQLAQSAELLDRFVLPMKMIGLASDAMDSVAIPTVSTFSTEDKPSRGFIRPLLRDVLSDRISQEDLVKIINAVSNYWTTERADRFKSSLRMTGIGRRLFVTDQGRVGVGPARMTTSDVIIIAYGGETQYVLRPVPGAGKYALLGDCYIYGFMDGRAVPKEDDPPTEWFCLGWEPNQTGVARRGGFERL